MAERHHGTANSTPPYRVTHRALCPICGRLAEREAHKPYLSGVVVSLYACPKAHLWQTQWAEVA